MGFGARAKREKNIAKVDRGWEWKGIDHMAEEGRERRRGRCGGRNICRNKFDYGFIPSF